MSAVTCLCIACVPQSLKALHLHSPRRPEAKSMLCHLSSFVDVQLRQKAAEAKRDAGGLAPLAHAVLEAQKDEQAKAAELAALKRCSQPLLRSL